MHCFHLDCFSWIDTQQYHRLLETLQMLHKGIKNEKKTAGWAAIIKSCSIHWCIRFMFPGTQFTICVYLIPKRGKNAILQTKADQVSQTLSQLSSGGVFIVSSPALYAYTWDCNFRAPQMMFLLLSKSIIKFGKRNYQLRHML